MSEIVEVVWDDAVARQGDLSIKQAIRKVKVQRTRTIGYLVAETDEGILMAQSYCSDKDTSEHILIPHGMIAEIWVWKDVRHSR